MSRVLEGYNNKISQIYKKGIHNGIDLIGEVGAKNNTGATTYILAHSNGVVTGVRKDYKTQDKTGTSYGNYVLIRHDNGYYTMYAHLKYGSVLPNVGTRVVKGERIGYMGSTGHSTGAHLHFEVRKPDNSKIDPTPYINADLPDMTTDTPNKDESTGNSDEVYIVRKGDTLWGIAQRYNMSWSKIYMDNKELIDKENIRRGIDVNKHWLYPNQKLIIRK